MGVEKPSKGAEKILLAQIKQEFSAPAEAIEQYIDLVEQFASQKNLDISSEISQIKEAEDKLLSQYEEAFRENTSADKTTKTSQEYSDCLLYTSPSPRDKTVSRMPSSA